MVRTLEYALYMRNSRFHPQDPRSCCPVLSWEQLQMTLWVAWPQHIAAKYELGESDSAEGLGCTSWPRSCLTNCLLCAKVWVCSWAPHSRIKSTMGLGR